VVGLVKDPKATVGCFARPSQPNVPMAPIVGAGVGGAAGDAGSRLLDVERQASSQG